jgi:glycerophosphoryl diester phosphodiesterase
MKKFTFLLAVVICAFTATAQEPQFHDNKVISHRGAWKNTGHPQNSLASFRAAAEMGCHGSECDVHLTADDSLVVNHDPTYNGLEIEKSTYAELVAFPLPNGEKLPTLREYINVAKEQTGTKLIIDVKNIGSQEHAIDIGVATARLVQEMAAEKWVEYLVAALPTYDAMREITTLPIAYLGRRQTELPEMHPDTMLRRGIEAVDYQDVHFFNHPEWVDTFRERGVHLNAWTINSEESMTWFLERDFDYITTDNPERLLERTVGAK